jgi:putative acetyltransferase
MIVRPERAADVAGVYVVNASAFPTSAEAKLVDALREAARPVVSLVAEEAGAIVGHIFFSPVTVPNAPTRVMGLAPMAVLPARQRAGIGGALVKAGLAACKDLGAGAVVVLGHVDYYPRFGFVPASRYGLRCEYDAPADAFMALELEPGALAGAGGTVKYHEGFAGLTEL